MQTLRKGLEILTLLSQTPEGFTAELDLRGLHLHR
jgi:hypothetical protein